MGKVFKEKGATMLPLKMFIAGITLLAASPFVIHFLKPLEDDITLAAKDLEQISLSAGEAMALGPEYFE